MASPELGLKSAVRTAIFRKTVQILQADPVLKRAVKTWKVWTGVQGDPAAELALLQAPGIRISPLNGPMTWWSPGTMKGRLIFAVELILKGLDADDIMNFQGAIEDALFPTTQAAMNAQVLALQAIGARTGQYEFMAPIQDPPNTAGADGALFRPYGNFSIEFNRNFTASA